MIAVLVLVRRCQFLFPTLPPRVLQVSAPGNALEDLWGDVEITITPSMLPISVSLIMGGIPPHSYVKSM